MENIKIEKHGEEYFITIDGHFLRATANELLTLSKIIKDMRTELEMESINY